jgi:hypothetical protein
LISTVPRATTIILGGANSDTATMTGTGGVTPIGSVTFWACAGASQPCDASAPGAVALGAGTASGSGNTATATSASFIPKTAGTYCFGAAYGGDTTYAPVSETSAIGECFTVSSSTVAEFVTAPGAGNIGLGNSITDTATLTSVSGVMPTGAVSYDVCGPDLTVTVNACTAASGTEVGAPTGFTPTSTTTFRSTSYAFTPTATGIYCFLGLYPGDAHYPVESDGSSTDECFSVTSPGDVTTVAASASIVIGASDTADATVTPTGPDTPTGTVHFYVCPAASDPCITNAFGIVDLGTVALSPAGASTATASSTAYTPAKAGSYCFLGVYSGDTNDPSAYDGSLTDGCFSVTAVPAPVALRGPESSSGTGDLSHRIGTPTHHRRVTAR